MEKGRGGGSDGAGKRPAGSGGSSAGSANGIGPPGPGGTDAPAGDGGARKSANPSRSLGVIEAFTVVTRSCPSGAVRAVAENALDVVKRDGARALPEQAYLVLVACRGWQGERATQVKESLRGFLDRSLPTRNEG